MSRLAKHASWTTASFWLGKRPIWFSLVAAGLVVGIVCRWGYERQNPVDPHPMYTATAYVIGQDRPDRPEEVPIPIACTDADPLRVEEIADALAERYVEDRRIEWQQQADEPYREAQKAVENAQRELADSQARLEEFHQTLAAQALRPPTTESPKPAMADNPEWLVLDRQLRVLRQRREELLTNRTPLHPAVQNLTVQIEALERQIDDVPRQIAEKLADVPDKGPALSTPEMADQDREQLEELVVAVEQNLQACKRAEAAEQEVLAAREAGPEYTVVEAKAVAAEATSEPARWPLWATTLVAGALMAFGVGAASTGAGIDPPVGTVGQVQAAARAPVLGVIRADRSTADPEKLSLAASKKRRALIALGLILMAACPVAAVWGASAGY